MGSPAPRTTLWAVHRIDLTNGASIRLDVDAYGNTVTYQGWSLEAGDFDMTPDGTKAVMAIQDRINPNEFSDGQTTKIFVKDLVTGSLTLIDDVDHSTGHSGHPRISDDGRFVYFQSDKDGFVDNPARPTVSITASTRYGG